MYTLFDLPSLPVADAVAAAEQLAPTEARAWEALDGVLRVRLVAWLQERDGDPEALAAALFRAGRAAGGRWRERWFSWLDVLREGGTAPARAAEVRALAGDQWAARVLRVVAERPPTPRRRVSERFPTLKDNHLSNVLAELEAAGLLRRSRAGRETTLLVTPAGARMAGLLGPEPAVVAPVGAPTVDAPEGSPHPVARSRPPEPRPSLWDLGDEDVS